MRKWSTVLKLTPVLDGIGLIVIGDRLSEASISQKSKFPVMLPSDHKVSCMITYDYHVYAHLCTEWVLSELRTLFWITRAWGMMWNYRHQKNILFWRVITLNRGPIRMRETCAYANWRAVQCCQHIMETMANEILAWPLVTPIFANVKA